MLPLDANVKILNLPLRVSSCTVTLRRMSLIQEPVRIDEPIDCQNDDYLAEFIKTLTQDDAHWLWLTVVQSKPHLAD
jgi:hypothetical protein